MSRYELYAQRYPLLPLKNVVIFPRNIVTLLVGRPRSIQAVEESLTRERKIVVTAHRDAEIEEPQPDDLYELGALAEVVSVERQQGGTIQVVLQGVSRVRLSQFDLSRQFYTVTADEFREPEPPPSDSRALIQHVQELAAKYAETRGKLSTEVLDMVQRASEPGHLADLLATQLLTDTSRRQELLEQIDPMSRLEQVAIHMTGEIDVAALEQKIKDRVRDQIDKNQREYYLREQLKAIHDELGGEHGNEIETLKARIAARGLPTEVEEKLQRELGRLERMPSVSAEATVVRTYIDTMLALPWTEQTEDRIDLDEAERLLNDDHYGLDQVKDRIIEFLAVRKLRLETDSTRAGAAQILCLA